MSQLNNDSEATTKKSFCRLCHVCCGMVLTLDARGRLVSVRADQEDPQTRGFGCFRGLQAVEVHYGNGRILHPLKRMPDGTFNAIPLEQALDEIAGQLRIILDRDGPDAVAGYKGTAAYFNTATQTLLREWLMALGSPKFFSSFTIDQSGKMVAAERVGVWIPGLHSLDTSDVALVFGANPLISVAALDIRNPHKYLKEAKERGLKLILIDPRRTETAHLADIFVQPLPGEDAAILAGMLRIIFENQWHDQEFCRRYVGDLNLLREAVAPFTPEYVARRADIPISQLLEITKAFACDAKRGCVSSATGPSMSPYSNLTEHLIAAINYVCGRVLREGEQIRNPGFFLPRYPAPAQVMPATRSWTKGPKSRISGYGTIGYGTVWSQMMTGVLADEILTPGAGQIRALINQGGNPLTAIPDQRKVARALRSLELLVSIDPHMSATAKLSHYILPPKQFYERAELSPWLFEKNFYPSPYGRYTDAIIDPPQGAEVAEEGYLLWALAKRLGVTLTCDDVPVDMSRPPTTDDLLAIVARHAPVSLEELKRHPYGMFYDEKPQFVEPGDPNSSAKLTLMPDDVLEEVKAYFSEQSTPSVVRSHGQTFTHRLATRRLRDRYNSFGGSVPAIKKRVPFNVVYMNPDDMTEMGLRSGDWVEIASDSGAIKIIAEADKTVRRGVVSMAHAFGNMPEQSDVEDYLKYGVSSNLLISTDRNLQSINAMPRMSGIPVNIRAVATPNIALSEQYTENS